MTVVGLTRKNTGGIADPTAIESHVHHLLFHRRKAAVVPYS